MTPLRSQVTVPTLVLAPATSRVTPLSDQVKIRDSIPGARIALVEGRSHEIYVDAPEACISALLKFLGSQS
jgi:pimeloyl-ACP methyl ester carboxylesterase